MSPYTIEVNNKREDVDYYIFRSWTGPRFIHGKPYKGPTYFLGSDELAEGIIWDHTLQQYIRK